NGTTTQPSSYEYTDGFAITTGETYWYWLQSVSYSNELEMYGPVSVLVEEGDIPDVPVSSSLYQNYPNPFNPTTTITFDIKEGDTGKLTIYNVLGQKVMEQEYPEGSQTLTWEAKDQASGIYFYNLKTGSYAATRKMLLLR
ncbi:MAG TPA: T9SS type A sorting domain-containing protein, partial [Candidatus Cloacimonadota bacterium]|nr:T9SS type A sorting domain-containing protein [Candidatus Cloacimonadota bacterium]